MFISDPFSQPAASFQVLLTRPLTTMMSLIGGFLKCVLYGLSASFSGIHWWTTCTACAIAWYSVVMVAGICNSVGGGVLFDIPARCWCRWRWRVQYAPCIAGQSSVPLPSPHASSQRSRQPTPPLLIIRCSTTRRDRCGGGSRGRSPQSRRRWSRSTAHKSTDRTSSFR